MPRPQVILLDNSIPNYVPIVSSYTSAPGAISVDMCTWLEILTHCSLGTSFCLGLIAPGALGDNTVEPI